MSVLRKVLKISGITFLSLIVLAFLVPILFKKQITRLVKNEINKNLTAKVDFADVKLSLLRHFPRMTIILKDLSIVGSGEFAGDTLIYAPSVDVSANFFSVIKGKNIKIYGAYLASPRIFARMTKEGNRNWDILKERSGGGDTAASAFKLSLKHYSIRDGFIVYKDERANVYTEWNNVDHRGSGDITQDQFTLSTVTHAEEASYRQDGIPYLAGTRTDIITDINIDTRANTYTFNTNRILLNDLKLSLKGFFQMVNDTVFNMDFQFRAPTSNFKNILSLIPDIYKQDFKNLQASGEAAFNGFVKGTYRPGLSPAYDVNLSVKNGSFKYPDLPKPVKNIQLTLRASNPDGLPDNAVFDVTNGHLEMDNEPFDFRFAFTKPRTARFIDAAAKGKLNLSELSSFIKLKNDSKLAGLVWADAYIKGNSSAIRQWQGPFTAGGFFDIKNLFYSSKNFPQPIRNGNMHVRLDNSGGIADHTTINIPSGHIELGSDPVDFSLQLRNPVSSVDFSGHAKGRFSLDHLGQFTPLDPGTSVTGTLSTDLDFAGNKAAITQQQYDKLLLDGAAGLTNFRFKSNAYPSGVSISNSQLQFNAKTVKLGSLSDNYLNTNFSATGVLNNMVGFIMKGDGITGNLDVKADKMDLDDWIGKSKSPSGGSAKSSSSPGPFLVPANMGLTIHAAVSQVNYDKVNYVNVNGNLVMEDEKVTFQNIKTNALEGDIVLNGSYSTLVNKQEPDIGFSYDIKNMDVQKAFYAFNTIPYLMPIGKFLSGKLNSQLSLVGHLQRDMMPKLMSLTGKGNLLLLKGVLMKFAPLEKLATILQIDRLKSISVKEIRNYIEFANGRVFVKPFTVKVEEIEMLISGFHGFDQSIDYAIKMKLPRKIMGAKGNELINDLAAKVNSKGLPFKLGETINLDVKVNGTISNPYIGINLKGMVDDVVKDMEQQAKDFIQAKLDSAKQKAKDSLAAVEKVLADKLKEKLKEQIFGKDSTNTPDSSKRKPTDILKNTIKDIIGRKKKKDSV